MSSYRILNILNKDTNIPVYTVQQIDTKVMPHSGRLSDYICGDLILFDSYTDLKEFISLEDAREYKYQLELINGIVVE